MTPRNPDEVTNVEVVTYSLAQLGGIDKPVHLEEIAVKAHEFTPGAFRWDLDRYASFIDKDKVRVSLTDAEKPEKGGLVSAVGTTRSGSSKRTDLWRLTSAGADWIVKNEERLQDALGVAAPRLKKGKAGALRRRLTATPLYREFAETGSITQEPYAFTDLLECSPDASNSVVRRRYDELKSQALLLDDPKLLNFIDALANAHADMLGR